MESLLNDLRTLLAEQVENLKTLETVLCDQRDHLAKRNIQGILASIEEQEKCLARVQEIESNRGGLMKRLSGILGLEQGNVSLKDISEKIDPDVGAEIRSMGEAIRGTLKNIGQVNRNNRKLIEHSLDFVQEMLGAIGGQGTQKRTYGETGSLVPREQARKLVDKTT